MDRIVVHFQSRNLKEYPLLIFTTIHHYLPLVPTLHHLNIIIIYSSISYKNSKTPNITLKRAKNLHKLQPIVKGSKTPNRKQEGH